MLQLVFLLTFMISGGAYVILGYTPYLYFTIFTLLMPLVVKAPTIIIAKRSFWPFALLSGLFTLAIIMRNEPIGYADNYKILMKFLTTYVFSWALCQMEYKVWVAVAIKLFENLMIISLILWALANTIPIEYFTFRAPDMWSNFGAYADWQQKGYSTFFGLYFIGDTDLAKFGFVRNLGLFWEPGAYGFFIILFYILKRLYLQQEQRLWLYFITLISTLSVGSFIIFMGLYVVIEYIERLHRRFDSGARYVSLIAIIFFTLGLCVLLYYIENYLSHFSAALFQRDWSTDSSIATRLLDTRYGLMAATDNILWGSGPDPDNLNYYLLKYENVAKQGLINGIVALQYRAGIIFWSLYMFLLWRLARRISPEYSVLIFLALVGMLMHEPLEMSLWILLLIMYPPPRTDTTLSRI